jgi:hypothetical protein
MSVVPCRFTRGRVFLNDKRWGKGLWKIVEKFGGKSAGVLLGAQRRAEVPSRPALNGRRRCVLAAPARGITKIRSVRRGRRTTQRMRNVKAHCARARKSFQPRSEAAERETKMRKTQRRELVQVSRRRQRDVLCDVMLSARQCETWLTLDELSKLTHYPPTSISAQLRHLRKPEYGGYTVEKRPRAVGKVLRGEDFGTTWEYQLRRVIRRKIVAARLRGGATEIPRQSVAC